MAAKHLDAIMLFGDSITQGAWEFNGIGARLSHIYARKLDVLNRGFSGYNTDWALPVFEKIVAKQHDQQHVSPPQHVPMTRFAENLSTMIHMIRSSTSTFYSPVTKIILIAPPPVNTFQRDADLASRDPPQELDRQFEATRRYAQEVLAVGKKEDVPVADIWTRLWEAAGQDERSLEQFLCDGLHLNEAGYQVACDELLKVIRDNYAELRHDQLEYVFPRHDYLYDHSVEEFKAKLVK